MWALLTNQWAQLASALLGVWLMIAPALLGYGGSAQTNDRIVGPLIAAFGFVAAWGVTRSLRWANLPLGVWLLVAPWVLGYGPIPTVNSLVVGVLVIALAFIRGRVTESYAGGWSSLLPGHRVGSTRPNPPPSESA